jgi:hypothetical protein
VIACRRVDLHSIGTMKGFHIVKSRQNETCHCRNQMNIIVIIIALTCNGKEGSKLSLQRLL